MDTNQSKASNRFVLVDALRGVAALVVLLFHLFHNADMLLVEKISQALPLFIPKVVDYGYYGVQIFFVLSGFVIAHSLRKTPLSLKSVGNFILRRQLRLDPPFWSVLFIVFCLLAIETRVPSLQSATLPTFREMLLNMTYLHKITGAREIVSVSWTLCIEIQFYLVFIALLIVGALPLPGRKVRLNADTEVDKVGDGTNAEAEQKAPVAALFLILAMGVYSLLARWLGSQEGSYANFWFLVYWCYFAGGVLCYWTIKRCFSIWLFLAYLAFLWVYAIGKLDMGLFFGAATLSLLAFAGFKNRLTKWGNFRPLQYLGRISYSLYLVHAIIIDYLFRGADKIFGSSSLVGLICIPCAILFSLGAAHLLHLAVERPSMALSNRFRLKEKIRSQVSGFAAPGNDSQSVASESA